MSVYRPLLQVLQQWSSAEDPLPASPCRMEEAPPQLLRHATWTLLQNWLKMPSDSHCRSSIFRAHVCLWQTSCHRREKGHYLVWEFVGQVSCSCHEKELTEVTCDWTHWHHQKKILRGSNVVLFKSPWAKRKVVRKAEASFLGKIKKMWHLVRNKKQLLR